MGPKGLSVFIEQRWITIHWDDIVLAERPAPSLWGILSRNGRWIELDTETWWRRRKLARFLEAEVSKDVRLPQSRRP